MFESTNAAHQRVKLGLSMMHLIRGSHKAFTFSESKKSMSFFGEILLLISGNTRRISPSSPCNSQCNCHAVKEIFIIIPIDFSRKIEVKPLKSVLFISLITH